jgi:hypothetical protein
MVRQLKSKLAAVSVTALMTGLILPGLARAEVLVNVDAIESNNSFTVVSVLAVSTSGQDPALWDLDTVFITHNGARMDIDVAAAEEYAFPLLHTKLWVVKIGRGLIDQASVPSDTMTADVDIGGTTVGDTAACKPGPRRTRISAICR